MPQPATGRPAELDARRGRRESRHGGVGIDRPPTTRMMAVSAKVLRRIAAMMPASVPRGTPRASAANGEHGGLISEAVPESITEPSWTCRNEARNRRSTHRGHSSRTERQAAGRGRIRRRRRAAIFNVGGMIAQHDHHRIARQGAASPKNATSRTPASDRDADRSTRRRMKRSNSTNPV